MTQTDLWMDPRRVSAYHSSLKKGRKILNQLYSAMIIDEVLPPLELARRRKSMLLGPRP